MTKELHKAIMRRSKLRNKFLKSMILSRNLTHLQSILLILIHPGDIKILGWCPAGPVLTSSGEVVSLALVGYPTSDSVTIKIPCGVEVLLHWLARTPSFLIGLVKTAFDFVVRSVETGWGRWMLVVAVISVDAYPFFFWLSQIWPVTLRMRE